MISKEICQLTVGDIISNVEGYHHVIWTLDTQSSVSISRLSLACDFKKMADEDEGKMKELVEKFEKLGENAKTSFLERCVSICKVSIHNSTKYFALNFYSVGARLGFFGRLGSVILT